MRVVTSASTGLLLVLAVGCGDEERDLREWRAEDHVQPAAPSPEQSAASAAEPSADQIARAAAALYMSRCASCHGAEGRGDGPAAPEGAEMASFASAAYQQERTDEELARVIATGSGRMPGFGSEITPRGIAALVAHVRKLGEGSP